MFKMLVVMWAAGTLNCDCTGAGGPRSLSPLYCDVINFIYIIHMSATLCYCTTICGLTHCYDRWFLAEIVGQDFL